MLVRFESHPAVFPLIDDMISFDREIDGLFGPTIAPVSVREGMFVPRMDVVEGKDDVVVTVELPGVRKEDVKIALEQDLLSISGERKGGAEPKDTQNVISERWSGKFSRSVRLPYEVQGSAVSAELADGLLTVVLPKAESAKPREIAVR